MRIPLASTLVAILACSPLVHAAAAPPADELKLTTERVVVFKDNYALLMKSGTARADADGRVHTRAVPDTAILGSFWAMGDGQKVLGMRAEWDEKRELARRETPAITVVEVLRANVGRKATLALTEKRTITGTIAQLLEMPGEAKGANHPALAAAGIGGFSVELKDDRSPFEMLAAGRVGHAIAYDEYGNAVQPTPDAPEGVMKRELPVRGGDFVVIDEAEAGRSVIPIAHVQSVAGKELSTTISRQEEIFTRQKRLSIDFGKEQAGKDVSLKLFYFAAGMRWIPTYRVSGELKDKAEIALQGEIMNELEDVENAAIDLVVGVPNFRFKTTPSPLTLERTLRGAMVQADPRLGRNNDFRNNMLNSQYSQAAGSFRGREVAGGANATLAPDLAASGEQDLFLYSMKGFSLKKGARSTMPLWQSTAPLRHLYTFEQRIKRNTAGGLVIAGQPDQEGRTDSPLRISHNQVWHQLELANNTNVPWTTGAALSLRNNQPLGQDLITYTPAGGCALLPVTVAVDVLGTHAEEEVSRKPNAMQLESYAYTLVRKKGTLKLTNYKKEKVTMKVSISTGGRVEEASDGGKPVINDFDNGDWQDGNARHANNHSDVTWDLSLEPGETRSVTYVVGFYVR